MTMHDIRKYDGWSLDHRYSLWLGFALIVGVCLLCAGSVTASDAATSVVPSLPDVTGASNNQIEINNIHYVSVEAENAKVIEPSFKVKADNQCSNRKYVSLPEGVGSSWAKSGIGHLEYEVTIPVAGEYALWGRCRWESGCSNLLDVDLGGAKPISRKSLLTTPSVRESLGIARFGKETTLNHWHWVGLDTYQLNAGKLKFTVENHDDGVAIDQWLLVNDVNFTPRGQNVWAFDTTFSGTAAAGWRLVTSQWAIAKDKDGSSYLEKQGGNSSPALVHMVRPDAFYARIKIQNSNNTSIYHGFIDHKNYELIQVQANSITTYSARGGVVTKSGSATAQWVNSLQETIIEVIREGKHLVVLRGGVQVLSVPDRDFLSNGLVGIDLAKGGKLTFFELQPITDIYATDFIYCPWGGRWLTEENSDWSVTGAGMLPKNGTGTLVGGEPWWRDLQLSWIVCPPDSGRWGAGICYRAPDNQYQIEFNGTKASLKLLSGSYKSVLASADVPDLAPGVPCRLTVNRVNDQLQVYADGKQLFDVVNSKLYSGKIALFAQNDVPKPAKNEDKTPAAKNQPKKPAQKGAKPNPPAAKPIPMLIEDSFVQGLSRPEQDKTNESVLWFNRPYRLVNSVFDNWGATGGFHPGNFNGSVPDTFLDGWDKRLSGRTATATGYVMDFQWISYNLEAFLPVYGLGKKPGYLNANVAISAGTQYLWSMDNVVGESQMTFSVEGTADKLGVIWIDAAMPTSAKTANVLRGVELRPRMKTLSTLQNNEASPLPWKDNGEHEVTVKNAHGCLSVTMDDEVILVEKTEDATIRPEKIALYSANATLKLDDIFVWVYPDLVYELAKNQPLSLSLSDWNVTATKQEQAGNYYMTHLMTGYPAKMESKRQFSGNLSMEVLFQQDSAGYLLLGTYDSGGSRYVRLNKDSVKLIKADSKGSETVLSEQPLKDYSGTNRRLVAVWLCVTDDLLRVFTSDSCGSGRLVLEQKVVGSPVPYRLLIAGSPALEIKDILIWGKPPPQKK